MVLLFFLKKNTLAQRLQIEMLPSHLILFHSQQAKPSKEKPFKRPLPSVCFGWRTRPRPVTSRHSLPLRSTLHPPQAVLFRHVRVCSQPETE